jgi:hypothetical protein
MGPLLDQSQSRWCSVCPGSITGFYKSLVKAKFSSLGVLTITLWCQTFEIQKILGNQEYEVLQNCLFAVTLSGKKAASEQQRRRRKEKNELPSAAENDDYDNALSKMEVCELQDNGAEKVGVPCIKILFIIGFS